MNLDETIKYYVEKAEDCEAIETEWREKAIEYRQTANYLIDLKEMKAQKIIFWIFYRIYIFCMLIYFFII